MISGMDVTVAETFLLLTLDEAGKDAAGAGSDAGLAAALVADLVLAGALQLDGEVLTPTPAGPPATDNVPLRQAYTALAAAEPAPTTDDALQTVLRELSPVRETIATRLVAAGVLGTERGRIFRVVRHPIAEPGAGDTARAGLIAALSTDQDPRDSAPAQAPRPDTVVLLALLRPFDLLEQLEPAPHRAEAAARAAALIDAAELPRILGGAVERVRGTLVAALAAAAASTAAASG